VLGYKDGLGKVAMEYVGLGFKELSFITTRGMLPCNWNFLDTGVNRFTGSGLVYSWVPWDGLLGC